MGREDEVRSRSSGPFQADPGALEAFCRLAGWPVDAHTPVYTHTFSSAAGRPATGPVTLGPLNIVSDPRVPPGFVGIGRKSTADPEALEALPVAYWPVKSEETRLHLYEPRFLGFARWVLERVRWGDRLGPDTVVVVEEVARGWWRPPKGWRYNAVEVDA